MLVDPPQDLGAINPALDDLLGSQPDKAEGHAPAVAMEHRQGVQVDVTFPDTCVHGEGHRVDPDVAMGQLHSFGPGGARMSQGHAALIRRGTTAGGLVFLPRPANRLRELPGLTPTRQLTPPVRRGWV